MLQLEFCNFMLQLRMLVWFTSDGRASLQLSMLHLLFARIHGTGVISYQFISDFL